MSAAVIDEPVRGTPPPPWFGALSGLERMQALARGHVPLPPFFRLFGIRPAHIGPGSTTWTMPASEWFMGGNGQIEFHALLETALTGTAVTAVPAGFDVEPLDVSVHFFRPSRPQRGSLRARARVVNASRFFVFTQAEIEDPDGRLLAHAASQIAIRPIEPPPPPPPETLPRVEAPTYATPDPVERPVTVQLARPETWETQGGAAALRETTEAGGFSQLLGMTIALSGSDRVVATLPASPWLCRFSQHVTPGILGLVGNTCGWALGLASLGPGETWAGLETSVRLYRPVTADGRLIRVETSGTPRGERFMEGQASISDADGTLVGGGIAFGMVIARGTRLATTTRAAKRTVLSLFFLDIVGSTALLDELGDARWRELLEKYREAVRHEIKRADGVEIDIAGDGFFARFESPASALSCARAARGAVKRLGIDVRAGVHAGECEVEGRTVAGMAVHVAARVMDAAGAGEILCSSTVRDLSAGSGLRFDDRGEHALKGVPDARHLYALVD